MINAIITYDSFISDSMSGSISNYQQLASDESLADRKKHPYLARDNLPMWSCQAWSTQLSRQMLSSQFEMVLLLERTFHVHSFDLHSLVPLGFGAVLLFILICWERTRASSCWEGDTGVRCVWCVLCDSCGSVWCVNLGECIDIECVTVCVCVCVCL